MMPMSKFAVVAAIAFAGSTALAYAQENQAAPAPSAQQTPATPPSPAAPPAAAQPGGTEASAATASTYAGATVKDAQGMTVGKVQDVKLDATGKPEQVTVDVGTKMVAVLAKDFRFDAASKTITVAMRKEQILALPAASS